MSDNKITRASEIFKEYDLTDMGTTLRLAILQNMYRDRYSGLIECVPGFRRIIKTDGCADSIAMIRVDGQPYVIYRMGAEWRVINTRTEEDRLLLTVGTDNGRIFTANDLSFIIDENRLYIYDGSYFTAMAEGDMIPTCKDLAIFQGRLLLLNEDGIYSSSELQGESIDLFREEGIAAPRDTLSLLSIGSCLWIFSKTSILCYGRDGYPLLRHIEGIRPTGQAMLINDKIVFLTEDGPHIIEDCHLPDKARVSRPFSKALSLLSAEKMREAALCTLEGYAAICSGSKILLLDLSTEECFLISEVGGYKGDRRVYRYSPLAKAGFSIHPKANSPAAAEVMSIITRDKETVYYTEEEDRLYSVYPTNERYGGELCPATAYAYSGDLLCFATECGILIFNNDMRGDGAKDSKAGMIGARRIPTYLYSFDGHAAKYIVATEYDDSGLPFAEKSSVGESLRLKILATEPLTLSVRVLTDKGEASRQTASLTPRATGEFCLTPTIVGVSERAHGWLEKQIVIEAEEFCAPFALSSIAFRFQQREKLKKG